MKEQMFLRAKVDAGDVELARTEAELSGCSLGSWIGVAIRQLAARESARRKRELAEEQAEARP